MRFGASRQFCLGSALNTAKMLAKLVLMVPNDPPKGKDGVGSLINDLRRDRAELEKTYRERALKMYPWICGRCGREFSGKKLRELTVHHKDHDHDNNPADGSNWELLCLYCHDNEHERNKVADAYDTKGPTTVPGPKLKQQPFSALEALLKPKK